MDKKGKEQVNFRSSTSNSYSLSQSGAIIGVGSENEMRLVWDQGGSNSLSNGRKVVLYGRERIDVSQITFKDLHWKSLIESLQKKERVPWFQEMMPEVCFRQVSKD